jgi:hypothetical protein
MTMDSAGRSVGGRLRGVHTSKMTRSSAVIWSPWPSVAFAHARHAVQLSPVNPAACMDSTSVRSAIGLARLAHLAMHAAQ